MNIRYRKLGAALHPLGKDTPKTNVVLTRSLVPSSVAKRTNPVTSPGGPSVVYKERPAMSSMPAITLPPVIKEVPIIKHVPGPERIIYKDVPVIKEVLGPERIIYKERPPVSSTREYVPGTSGVVYKDRPPTSSWDRPSITDLIPATSSNPYRPGPTPGYGPLGMLYNYGPGVLSSASKFAYESLPSSRDVARLSDTPYTGKVSYSDLPSIYDVLSTAADGVSWLGNKLPSLRTGHKGIDYPETRERRKLGTGTKRNKKPKKVYKRKYKRTH